MVKPKSCRKVPVSMSGIRGKGALRVTKTKSGKSYNVLGCKEDFKTKSEKTKPKRSIRRLKGV